MRLSLGNHGFSNLACVVHAGAFSALCVLSGLYSYFIMAKLGTFWNGFATAVTT